MAYKFPDRTEETAANDVSSSITYGRLLRSVSTTIPLVEIMPTLQNEHVNFFVNQGYQFLSWIAYDKSTSSKHREWLHPIIVCLIHYTIVGSISVGAHDLLLYGHDTTDDAECSFEVSTFRRNVAISCGWYTFAMQACRLYTLDNKQAVVYEMTWLCNVTLVMGPLGLYWNRPIIASAYCITIGIDQLLWYIDLLWYTMR